MKGRVLVWTAIASAIFSVIASMAFKWAEIDDGGWAGGIGAGIGVAVGAWIGKKNSGSEGNSSS